MILPRFHSSVRNDDVSYFQNTIADCSWYGIPYPGFSRNSGTPPGAISFADLRFIFNHSVVGLQ
ncbi:MAG TPA: hypothetical protein VIK10_01165 [Prolixibacteraceae bacterium]